MKIKITEARIQNSEFRSVAAVGASRSLTLQSSQRGLALVITLILLSVTLVMTIAFLALSKRERASVTTSTDTTVARLAADTALAAAQAQILANIFTTNAALYNYHLLVSTNYINSFGYTPGSANPTNVNWDYFAPNYAGNNWTPSDFNQNVANLLFLPRVPVFVTTNNYETNGRFYLDLNRNGAFEDTGEAVNEVEVNASGNGITNGTLAQVGDPQWVGILERPGTLHAADNKFVSRYAFIALPVGESLDLNAIHNQVLNLNLGVLDGYSRNQGVGSWEINLAAFLADLNTNQWDSPTLLNNANNPYYYRQFYGLGQPSLLPNVGAAFEDARALLSWRYNYNYGNLDSANFIFGTIPAAGLQQNNIDEYGDGPLQITPANINESLVGNADNTARSWAGANNPNRFFALPSELFDPAKSSGGVTGGFTNHLLNAGNTITPDGARPSYDRYTYYRMLDQLGTDTIPADDRLNLNYSNAVVRVDANGAFVSATIVPGAETNLMPWTPTNFFFAAADRLLKTYTTNWFHHDPSNFLATYYRITGAAANYYHQDGFGNVITNDPTGFGLTNIPYFGMTNELPAFGLGNIPVLVAGQFVYSPSINRLLQLAANIYDASTNDFYPHTYRPVFEHRGGDVFIISYQEVSPLNSQAFVSALPITVETLTNTYPAFTRVFENVYDVPWIIGAKKHLPNFNGFYSYNTMQVTRKLQFSRAPAAVGQTYNALTANLYHTNQMILLGITNSVGFSMWNSYLTNYSQGVSNYPFVTPSITISMTNYTLASISNGAVISQVGTSNSVYAQNITGWPGSFWDVSQPATSEPSQRSFVSGKSDLTILPTDSLWFDAAGNFIGFSAPGWNLPIYVTPVFPHITLRTTNQFQSYILDHGYVVDYVHFRSVSKPADLAEYLKDTFDPSANYYQMWNTNLNSSGLNSGVEGQIYVSQFNAKKPPGGKWTTPSGLPSSVPDKEAGTFYAFFVPKVTRNGNTYTNSQLTNQAPYSPVRTVVTPTVLVANDPLVHYLASDLHQSIGDLDGNGSQRYDDPSLPNILAPNLVGISERYQPWGRNEDNKSLVGNLLNQEESKFYLALKDPLVTGSDDWDFPTNHYPSAGWLGRVHRGTPWQTIYLKATNVLEYAPIDNSGVAQPIGRTTWNTWLGDFDNYDSGNSRPIQDALLFDVFTASPHPNATRGALSVNQAHLAAWSALLSGMMALTNITDVPSFDVPPSLTNVVIDPAGLNQVDSPLWQIVNGADGINPTRANKNIFAAGAFTRVGDILRVPALTEKSPFINRTNVDASGNGLPFGDMRLNEDISDEQYEWLPQQMLGLLRCTTAPRYVVYSYGQTLKPAVGGTVLASAFFGLVTNYQVVAESATRAVLSVQPVLSTKVVNGVVVPTTNYTTRVESFNPLPPE